MTTTDSMSHYGSVGYVGGNYVRQSGTANWDVRPIAGFDPPIRAPLGMIEIRFHAPIPEPYAVLVTPHRQPNTPLIAADYGDVTADGFVVHLWETVADRTVQNAGFSFAVLRTPATTDPPAQPMKPTRSEL